MVNGALTDSRLAMPPSLKMPLKTSIAPTISASAIASAW
jgi:hypothetical protein